MVREIGRDEIEFVEKSKANGTSVLVAFWDCVSIVPYLAPPFCLPTTVLPFSNNAACPIEPNKDIKGSVSPEGIHG